MFRKPEQMPAVDGRIGGEVVAAWHERRDRLRSKIADQADAEWNWLWRTRLAVLQFLLQRYAPKQASRPVKFESAVRVPEPGTDAASAKAESTSPYDRVPPERGFALSQEKREAIHRKLQSLRRTNEPRYIEAERQAQQIRELEAALLAKYLRERARIQAMATALEDAHDAVVTQQKSEQTQKKTASRSRLTWT